MRIRHPIHTLRATALLLAALFVAASSCSDDARLPSAPDEDPPAAVLLKDVVTPHLPSPYYHFEYDTTGRVSTVSFASGLTRYQLAYVSGRLSELRKIVLVSTDRLRYSYDDAGRVSEVRYSDADGSVFAIVRLSYDGQRLIGLERQRKVNGAFVVDKTLSMTYDSNGNLFTLTEHHPRVAGVQEQASATVDRFEDYDTGINVDAFDLLHSEFFDHLVLLPRVHLQHGNPRRVTRTGDGPNFVVEYGYTYDDRNRPLAKTGDLLFSTGPNAGQRFEVGSVFSYY